MLFSAFRKSWGNLTIMTTAARTKLEINATSNLTGLEVMDELSCFTWKQHFWCVFCCIRLPHRCCQLFIDIAGRMVKLAWNWCQHAIDSPDIHHLLGLCIRCSSSLCSKIPGGNIRGPAESMRYFFCSDIFLDDRRQGTYIFKGLPMCLSMLKSWEYHNLKIFTIYIIIQEVKAQNSLRLTYPSWCPSTIPAATKLRYSLGCSRRGPTWHAWCGSFFEGPGDFHGDFFGENCCWGPVKWMIYQGTS